MAYGFAIYNAAGNLVFSDAMLNMRFYKEETVAADSSPTTFTYSALAGKAIVAYCQISSGGSAANGAKRYHAVVDYSLGYPRVTVSYPSGTFGGANYAAVILIFVTN